MDIKFDGIEDVISGLELVEQDVNRAANKGLKEAGKYVKEEMEVLTNVSDVKKHRYGEGHARYDVKISGISGGFWDKQIKIGYTKTGWRMHFPDRGTKYQKAQNILENSVINTKDDVEEAIAREIENVVD